jgi:hypothetical protein
MMTRKHFEAVAAILKHNTVDVSQHSTEHEIGRANQSYLIASELADFFASENPNFDRARFMKASTL